LRVLMIGDVVGSPGRKAVQQLVPPLRREFNINLVVANGENSAGGFGVTYDTAQDLLGAGVDVITTGNHVWRKKEIIPYLQEDLPIVRPSNFPPGIPGRGFLTVGKVMVLNLMGRVFMEALDCPFREAERVLKESKELGADIILVDFHAEATSEKQALGWYLDGRVSAVVGTHTHVATADARIMPEGTAYVSDLGMVGPVNSVIGTDPNAVLEKFLTQMPQRFTVAKGPVVFNSVLINIDDDTGRASSIERIDRLVD
jgi:metallophosphoesterase (TIGR00282 family)